MDCYSSSNPVAVNATVVYDSNVHQGEFWSRTIDDVRNKPLLNCSSTSLPVEKPCTVCLDQVVYAICHKLKDGVVVIMEALQHPVKISKSDCPKLLPDDSPQWLLPVAIALIMFFLIVFGVFFYRRYFHKPNDQRRPETSPPQEADPFPV